MRANEWLMRQKDPDTVLMSTEHRCPKCGERVNVVANAMTMIPIRYNCAMRRDCGWVSDWIMPKDSKKP